MSEPAAPVHELVRERARHQPDTVAVDGLRYRELDRWTDEIATMLVRAGIPARSPVAIRFPVGAPHIAALLGVMKAGCHVVPIGPDDPVDRAVRVIASIRPACLLVADVDDPVARCCGPLSPGGVLALPPFDVLATTGTTAPPPIPDLDTPAYVVHTSGTTGGPKGVVQSHRGLAQFIAWMGTEFRMGRGRRTALWAAPHYDASLCEILATLVAGGTVCPVPDDIRIDAGRLVDWLAEQHVELLQTVPSFARELLHALRSRDLSARRNRLDHLLLAGEPLPGPLAGELLAAVPGLRLVNLYGTTETILATWLAVDRDWPGMVPIGRAIPGRDVIVVDGDRRCPVDVVGEIVVRGRYSTLGYWDESRRSPTGFPPLTLADEDSNDLPCYRTGDRGHVRPDGMLVFDGRCDDQVKVRGVRVEPAEIETVLARHPAVAGCAVTVTRDDGESPRIVAYVVPGTPPPSPDELRTHLRGQLPEQMWPAEFVPLAMLPRNAGGKVDRGRLPRPDSTTTQRGGPTASRRLRDFRSWSAALDNPTDLA